MLSTKARISSGLMLVSFSAPWDDQRTNRATISKLNLTHAKHVREDSHGLRALDFDKRHRADYE
jgi:hypothetical protein